MKAAIRYYPTNKRMKTPLTTPSPFDARRLPPEQLDWARAVVEGCSTLLNGLPSAERALHAAMWKYLARYHAPATSRQFGNLSANPADVQQTIISLNTYRLLWYDDDLRAVLQCPPFSVLHTAHQVKAFGWERIYVSSFIDIPITLLVYGPNVWVNAQSLCPRSGETLAFKLKMREDWTFQVDAPREASGWRIWIPLPPEPAHDAFQQFHLLRPRINAYHSLDDLETQRQYQGNTTGPVYSLEQSLYLSALLLHAYGRVLEA